MAQRVVMDMSVRWSANASHSKKHPAYPVSISVVLLNITVMILLVAHLLNSLQAARHLSQSLGTNLDWYALLRGEKVSLFGPMLLIGLMGAGALLELGTRPSPRCSIPNPHHWCRCAGGTVA
jgi:hypothetical protein